MWWMFSDIFPNFVEHHLALPPWNLDHVIIFLKFTLNIFEVYYTSSMIRKHEKGTKSKNKTYQRRFMRYIANRKQLKKSNLLLSLPPLVWPWLGGCWRKLQFHNPRGPRGGCILHSWWEWIFPKSKICKICIFDNKRFFFPQGDSIHPALARALEHLRQQSSFRRI